MLLSRWTARNAGVLERADRLLEEVKASPAADLAMLSVALAQLRALA